ncbi:MAG TPA: SPOR domain-containing protein [Bacteroidetes bacterium]|nr:SPOR domain-containing protein [Bacteroidota bacterium]
MLNLRTFALLVFSGILLTGCATTKKTVSEEKSKPVPRFVEDFDPMSLTDDQFTIPPKAAEVSPPVDTAGVAPAEQPREVPAEKRIKTVKVPGYRIQIAAVSNQEDAAKIQREAMLQFEDVNVYLTFEPPFYKVRIGDFERRHDAEEYQRKAIAAGYKDAWIVRTMIVKKIVQN